MRDYGVEEGDEVVALLIQFLPGYPLFGDAVDRREVELRVVCPEREEKLEDKIEDFVGAGVLSCRSC